MTVVRDRIRPHADLAAPATLAKGRISHPRCPGSWSVTLGSPAMAEALVEVGYCLQK